MLLRKLILKAAIAVASVIAVPSISKADITIQVVEINSSGTPISGSLPGESGNPLNFSVASPATSLSSGASATPNYTISNINTSLTTLGNSNFLSTTLNLSITNFSSSDGLQITVGYTGLTNTFPLQPATFTNQPSDTNQTSGPSNFTVTSMTSVNGTSTPGSTAVATNSNSGSGPTTSGTVTSLPSPYSLTQTITAYLTPTSGSVTGVINAGIDSQINLNSVPSAVPAPGGLALALIALPLLGLRRSLRRKTVQVAI